MNRILLAAASVALGVSSLSANVLYETPEEYLSEYGMTLTGGIYNVSPNGRYAVGGDTYYHIGCMWSIEDPTNFVILPLRGEGYDVTDEGVVVGCFRLNPTDETSLRPGVYKDGEWKALPLHENVLSQGMTTIPRAISKDGKYIGGNMTVDLGIGDDDDEITGGKRYPCRWTLNEATGEYELSEVYYHEDILNQGFFTTCMSDDGRIIAGMLTCGGGSSTVPAMVKDGEFHYWNKFETRAIPYYYKDKLMGYFDYYFIDGHHDNSGSDFVGGFRSIGTDGRIYGYRTTVTDIVVDKEEGLDHGTLHLNGIIYNPETDEFEESRYENQYYLTGIEGDEGQVIFTQNGVLIGDYTNTLGEEYDVESENRDLGIIYSISEDGKVLGGGTGAVNPATGDIDEYPIVIVLDKPIVGVDQVLGLDENVAIIVSGRRVEVAGAENVAIYDLDGRLVSSSESSTLEPGAYVVNADKVSRKVIIK